MRTAWLSLISLLIALPAQASSDGGLFAATAEDPGQQPWARQAQALMEKWYPRIAKLLGVKDRKPSQQVTLFIKSHGDGVAGTDGFHIEVNGEWVRKHPEDIGLVVHELTHVVQHYPNYDPGWLVEGIADYVRWFNYEPKSARPKVDPAKADYHDGYRVAAAFLDWTQRKYDRGLVKQLNSALAENKYSPTVWVSCTHKSLDELWAEYKGSLLQNRGSKPPE